MNRDRAKKLLPIIQAYAEGKQIQCRFVDHEDWHDVDDNDGIIDGSRYEYRIKPSEKYNEIFKLKSLLEENHIPFEWIVHNDFRNEYQICYPEKDEKRVCSVIEHSFSYGSQKDLLEIQGLLTADEELCDSVLGNLTATDVFQRILSHWEKINRIKPEEDGEITSIEELKEAIFSKREEIRSKGVDDSLFLYITISKNMVKAIEKRYSCVFSTDKESVNTFLGIPFVIGDKTKVEIKDRLVELLKKECEKPASCRFSKKGIELDKVESLLSELSKRGVFILAKEIDARLFPGTDGKLRMKEMDCTIHFYEAENTKENL
ncbi:MAG: hypothetical protein IKI40_06435 [Treponema sp.]|nr:hypothetical protein [Treponema sp.]